jgi:SAM-dependent methyltransferase
MGTVVASDNWSIRQRAMEEWYEEFAADQLKAVEALTYELRPHEGFLRGLRGRVLDVGGGAGLASMYLAPEVEYYVIDPSDTWAKPEWSTIRQAIAPDGPEPQFMTGIAEDMPYANASFGAILAFWSLNHTADPARVIAEMHRVLRRSGKALLVLEDMEPSWPDVAALAFQEWREAWGRPVSERLHWNQEAAVTVRDTARCRWRGAWPLQDDHIRIRERDLERWCSGRFLSVRREWLGGFLCREVAKL